MSCLRASFSGHSSTTGLNGTKKETNDLVVFKKGRGGGKEGESDPSADVFDTARFLESLMNTNVPFHIQLMQSLICSMNRNLVHCK